MVVTDKIAAVYAEALLELSREGKLQDEIKGELSAVADLISEDSVIWKFFRSPLMSADEKMRLIEKAFKSQVSSLLYNFIGVLASRQRLEYLPSISIAYESLVDKEMGRSRVTVETSVDIKPEQTEGLKEALKKLFHKEIILEMQENPDLIGGMVIRSGDFLIDTSVKTGLESLKQSLLKKKILGEEYYEN